MSFPWQPLPPETPCPLKFSWPPPLLDFCKAFEKLTFLSSIERRLINHILELIWHQVFVFNVLIEFYSFNMIFRCLLIYYLDLPRVGERQVGM